MEQLLQTITRRCNLEKPSGCLKLLTRSYCLLLALEMNKAFLCSHFCFSLLACKQALEKDASISQICRDTGALKLSIMVPSLSVPSPVFRNHSPELGAQAHSTTSGESWVPQVGSTDVYSIRRKTQGHSQPFNHGGKSLATKHRPEISLREFIGSGRRLVCLDILQLSLQLQSGFRTLGF